MFSPTALKQPQLDGVSQAVCIQQPSGTQPERRRLETNSDHVLPTPTTPCGWRLRLCACICPSLNIQSSCQVLLNNVTQGRPSSQVTLRKKTIHEPHRAREKSWEYTHTYVLYIADLLQNHITVANKRRLLNTCFFFSFLFCCSPSSLRTSRTTAASRRRRASSWARCPSGTTALSCWRSSRSKWRRRHFHRRWVSRGAGRWERDAGGKTGWGRGGGGGAPRHPPPALLFYGYALTNTFVVVLAPRE